jgi:hypothetical protein
VTLVLNLAILFGLAVVFLVGIVAIMNRWDR